MAKKKKSPEYMWDPGPEPTRHESIQRWLNVYGMTLQEVIDQVPEASRSTARFEGYDDIELSWFERETDDEFQTRLSQHRNMRKMYDEWFEENREAIEERERKDLEWQIKELNSQKKTFEKSLETTKKKLSELNRKGRAL